MRTHYEPSTWKPHPIWWAERKEAERLRKERYEWETARDEKIQNLMQFKERAEDFCSVRIVNVEGSCALQLRAGDQPFEALTYIADYEQVTAVLKAHIPNLEYDPRIASELKLSFP